MTLCLQAQYATTATAPYDMQLVIYGTSRICKERVCSGTGYTFSVLFDQLVMCTEKSDSCLFEIMLFSQQ
jgi:hypothetical protein